MKKVLINLFLFTPLILFGCFSGMTSLTVPKKSEVILSPVLETRESKFIREYGDVVKKYSTQYGIDWRLALAVMKSESQFIHGLESTMGAQGLMQIMPETMIIVATDLGLQDSTFLTPEKNIQAGVYFLSKIFKLVQNDTISTENRMRFTLVAYVAGIGRLSDAQKMAVYLNDDPNEWMAIKNALPMLSMRYSSLHSLVWSNGRPTAGFFREGRHTSWYVETVMETYSQYTKVLS